MAAKRRWIRKDRENYFLAGALATLAIAGYMASYWHYSDRLSVITSMKTAKKALSKKAEFEKLKETPIYAPAQKKGATRYYKVEKEIALPKIPELKEDDGN